MSSAAKRSEVIGWNDEALDSHSFGPSYHKSPLPSVGGDEGEGGWFDKLTMNHPEPVEGPPPP